MSSRNTSKIEGGEERVGRRMIVRRGKATQREKYTGFTPREYDRALIAEQLRVLRVQKKSGDVEEIMFGLRAELLKNWEHV